MRLEFAANLTKRPTSNRGVHESRLGHPWNHLLAVAIQMFTVNHLQRSLKSAFYRALSNIGSVEQHQLRLNWQEEDSPGYLASLDDYTATCAPMVDLGSSPLHDCYQYMLLFSVHLG
jgi:hypothetical protein